LGGYSLLCYNYFMEKDFTYNEQLGVYGFKKKWYKRPGCLIFFVLFLVIMVLAAVFGIKVLSLVQKIKSGEISIPDSSVSSQAPGNVSKNAIEKFNVLAEDSPSLGSKSAPVTIVEFSDFECSLSRQAFPIIREMVSIYGNNLRYIYRHFPLDSIHPDAFNAALAAECANEQGKFWAYHDKLFLNQDKLDIDSLKSYAVETGLDAARFNNCLDGGQYREKINRDLSDGIFAGVGGTPTWFIDGVKVEGVIPADVFRKIIDEQIEIKK
jgi:protein-disulfide isomerase